jgi:hypothetical protein
VPGSNSLLEAFQTSACPSEGAAVVISTSDKSPIEEEVVITVLSIATVTVSDVLTTVSIPVPPAIVTVLPSATTSAVPVSAAKLKSLKLPVPALANNVATSTLVKEVLELS